MHARAGTLPVGDDPPALPLHAEQAVVSKRVRQTKVRVERSTRTRNQIFEVDLLDSEVVVERVTVGRVVDAIPEIRQEGDVTILPVVEEELVVLRRLVLREEVHVRRVQTTRRHVETVSLREQQAVVTRTAIED